MGCASTSKNESDKAPASDDLLELLTGFGESISKRNYLKAVDFMVPEEKAMMIEGGVVPEQKQKMLSALPLQKLIRHPGIRVENGHISGIYAVLPNLRQGEVVETTPSDEATEETLGMGEENMSETINPMALPNPDATVSEEESEIASGPDSNDPRLKETINKFFSAVNKKNWAIALALMNDEEKKFLLDDKGRLKESAKKRLSEMDQQNREALLLLDGKLSGVTLLLPAN
jgi:hypothetical protein